MVIIAMGTSKTVVYTLTAADLLDFLTVDDIKDGYISTYSFIVMTIAWSTFI